jgi:hypothetical protein
VVASEGGWVCACVCVGGGAVRRVGLRCKAKLLGYRMCVCVCVCVMLGPGGRLKSRQYHTSHMQIADSH